MKAHVRTVVGIIVTLALLGWVLRDVSPSEVVHELRQADLWLLTLSIGVTMLGFAMRALRWGVLLRPVAPEVPFRARWAAVMIGFAANNLLPARVGEFARALTLARVSRVGAPASFATLVVERILDGFAVVGLLFIAISLPGFPSGGAVGGVDPQAAARVVGVVMGVIGLGLMGLVLAPSGAVRFFDAIVRRFLPDRLAVPLVSALESFLTGLSVLRHARRLLLSLVLAFGQWFVTAWSYYLAFLAFRITEVPFSGGVFLQSLVSLAVAIPSSPGFFGPFEAAARLGLSLWDVPAERAVSYAVGYHIAGFIPVTIIGIYYVWSLKLSWREVRSSEETVEARVEAASGAADTEGRG